MGLSGPCSSSAESVEEPAPWAAIPARRRSRGEFPGGSVTGQPSPAATAASGASRHHHRNRSEVAGPCRVSPGTGVSILPAPRPADLGPPSQSTRHDRTRPAPRGPRAAPRRLHSRRWGPPRSASGGGVLRDLHPRRAGHDRGLRRHRLGSPAGRAGDGGCPGPAGGRAGRHAAGERARSDRSAVVGAAGLGSRGLHLGPLDGGGLRVVRGPDLANGRPPLCEGAAAPRGCGRSRGAGAVGCHSRADGGDCR